MPPSIPHGEHCSRPYLLNPHERLVSKTCGRDLPVSSDMLDWLAVGWNLAMTISGAFLVSLSFRTWPLRFDRAQTVGHTLLAVFTALVLMIYPDPLIRHLPPLSPWEDMLSDLRYVPLVALMLAYRPGWALLAGIVVSAPQVVHALLAGQTSLAWPPLAVTGGVLLMTALQKRDLGILNFTVREAALRLPLIFLPCGLPFLFSPAADGSGWDVNPAPALMMVMVNLTGFLAGVMVLRSRFKLLAVSARLSQLAHTDPLTGLGNRRQLEQDLAKLPPGGHVLVMDLDYFKTINDRFGHDVGDEYLVSTAAALKTSLQRAGTQAGAGGRRKTGPFTAANPARQALSDQVYRIGGEEFALLSPSGGPEHASALAARVMDQVRQVRHRANPGGQITCSVGLARRREDESPQSALRRADAALMHAKANGRNRAETAELLAQVPVGGLPGTRSGPAARPAQPLLWEAIHASLSLAALDRDLTTHDWTRLLQAAILSVPGAESASINVRRGSRFVKCAQIGFDDVLLRLSHSEAEQLAWYGLGQDAWKRGQPRVLYGADIAAYSDNQAARDDNVSVHFQESGRVADLQASLCIPVLMDGDVVAHLNLDRSSDQRPFDEEDLRVARAFADQVTVLTVAARRRQALEEQRREQNWLVDFGLELLAVRDARSVTQCLISGLKALYGLDGAVVSGETPPVRTGPGQFTLVLESPRMVETRVLLWRDTEFSPQEQHLFAQAARSANTALHSLAMRDTALAEATPGDVKLSVAMEELATPKRVRR